MTRRQRMPTDATGSALARLELAKDAAELGIHDFDPITGRIEWDERCRAIWGLPPGAPVTFDDFRDGLHPDDRAATDAAVARALDPSGDGRYRAEYRVRSRADGRERWVAATGRVTFVDGRATRLVGTVADITERRRIEEALRESEARLVETLAFASAGTWEWDIPADQFRWSRESSALFGVEHTEQPTAEMIRAIVHPDDLAVMFAALDRVVVGESDHYRLEFRVRHPEGERWILGAGSIDRARRRIRGLNVDITDRKRAEERLRENEARLQLALAGGRVGIWEYDASENRVFWSTESHAIMGYELGAFAGTGDAFFALVHPDDLPGLHARLRPALERGEPFEHTFRVVRRDGETRWIENVATAIRNADGTVRKLIGTVRDVTEARAAEAALRAVDAQRTEFLAVLSHELRNPLAPIRSSLVLLEHAAPGSDAQRRAREVLRRQTEQLVRLVDDLLDVTRISRDKFELRRERLDAREVALRTAEDLRPEFERRGLALSLASPPEPAWVDADAARLAQMLGNLLHNALKFTPAPGAVEVTVRAERDRCELSVRDTGAGLAADELDAIFGAFMQSERTRRESGGGLGIGLALVRELAVRHGGSVRAASPGPGLGATFTIELPLADRHDAGRDGP